MQHYRSTEEPTNLAMNTPATTATQCHCRSAATSNSIAPKCSNPIPPMHRHSQVIGTAWAAIINRTIISHTQPYPVPFGLQLQRLWSDTHSRRPTSYDVFRTSRTPNRPTAFLDLAPDIIHSRSCYTIRCSATAFRRTGIQPTIP